MRIFSIFKGTVLPLFFCFVSCGQESKKKSQQQISVSEPQEKEIRVAADRTSEYLPLLVDKKVGIVANQTSVIFMDSRK